MLQRKQAVGASRSAGEYSIHGRFSLGHARKIDWVPFQNAFRFVLDDVGALRGGCLAVHANVDGQGRQHCKQICPDLRSRRTLFEIVEGIPSPRAEAGLLNM